MNNSQVPKKTPRATISFQLESFQNQRSQGASQHYTSNVHDDLSQGRKANSSWKMRSQSHVENLILCAWIIAAASPGSALKIFNLGTTCRKKKTQERKIAIIIVHHVQTHENYPNHPNHHHHHQDRSPLVLENVPCNFPFMHLGLFCMPNTSSVCARENIRHRHLWTYNLNVVWPITSFKPLIFMIVSYSERLPFSNPWLRFDNDLTNMMNFIIPKNSAQILYPTFLMHGASILKSVKIMGGHVWAFLRPVCLCPRNPRIWSYECWESQRTTPGGWQLWNLKHE